MNENHYTVYWHKMKFNEHFKQFVIAVVRIIISIKMSAQDVQPSLNK